MDNKYLKKGVLYLMGIFAAIIWSAAAFIIGNPSKLGGSGWFSYAFVLVSIAVAVTCFSLHTAPNNDSSLIGIPFYYSILFVGLSVIINGAFLLTGTISIRPLIIVADVILLVVYLAIILFSYLYHERLPQKIRKAENQLSFTSSVSNTLGSLLAMCADPDTHQALKSLKEKVDYSSNTSKEPQLNIEITDKLASVRASIERKADKNEVILLIEELGSLWDKKNAMQ